MIKVTCYDSFIITQIMRIRLPLGAGFQQRLRHRGMHLLLSSTWWLGLPREMLKISFSSTVKPFPYRGWSKLMFYLLQDHYTHLFLAQNACGYLYLLSCRSMFTAMSKKTRLEPRAQKTQLIIHSAMVARGSTLWIRYSQQDLQITSAHLAKTCLITIKKTLHPLLTLVGYRPKPMFFMALRTNNHSKKKKKHNNFHTIAPLFCQNFPSFSDYFLPIFQIFLIFNHFFLSFRSTNAAQGKRTNLCPKIRATQGTDRGFTTPMTR